MNLEEVPQHKKQFKDGGQAPKRVLYVTNTDGSYTQTGSEGWEVENDALQQAWEEIERQLQEAKQGFLNGSVSPILYYMIRQRMDIGILAAYVGKWKWQVKRHMKPGVFASLSDDMLRKYAEVFNVSIDELKNIQL